ncbi:MAG: hypothetical protein QOH74_878 [Gaiellales bacterium]|jgi:anti-anti-sigma regulatory factor|nr:hypothetical protein [Gaiellales bacterium]
MSEQTTPTEHHDLEVFRSRTDRSEVIVCHGWVDADTCRQLEQILDAAFDEGVERLRLDLANVLGIDAAGMRCLLMASIRCKESGALLEMQPSDIVLDALRTSGIAEQFAA